MTSRSEKADAKHGVKCNKSFRTAQHLNRHLLTKKHREGKKTEKAVKIKIPKKKRKQKKEEWEEGYVEEMEEDLDNWELPTMADVDFDSLELLHWQ